MCGSCKRKYHDGVCLTSYFLTLAKVFFCFTSTALGWLFFSPMLPSIENCLCMPPELFKNDVRRQKK